MQSSVDDVVGPSPIGSQTEASVIDLKELSELTRLADTIKETTTTLNDFAIRSDCREPSLEVDGAFIVIPPFAASEPCQGTHRHSYGYWSMFSGLLSYILNQ